MAPSLTIHAFELDSQPSRVLPSKSGIILPILSSVACERGEGAEGVCGVGGSSAGAGAAGAVAAGLPGCCAKRVVESARHRLRSSFGSMLRSLDFNGYLRQGVSWTRRCRLNPLVRLRFSRFDAPEGQHDNSPGEPLSFWTARCCASASQIAHPRSNTSRQP